MCAGGEGERGSTAGGRFGQAIGVCVIAGCAVLGAAAGRAAGEPAVSFKLGQSGLRSVRFAGEEFIDRAGLRVGRAVMKRWDGSTFDAGTRELRRELDRDGKLLRVSYEWGTVAFMCAGEGNGLRLTIDVMNTSDAILAEFGMQLAEMRFPRPPKGWVQHMPYRSFNLGRPTVHVADCGKTIVSVCNEDVGRPLLLGWAGRQSVTRRPLVLATASDWMQHMLNPMMYRPVYPGGHDRFEVSLRFAPGRTPVESIAGDLWKRFAGAHPFRLKWDDRRPIGALHLSSSNMKIEKNPRGWFNDRNADSLSDGGRKAFRTRLLEYARGSVEILKGIDAQGMITWDIEGQEYPHAISYLGDPRSLPAEMEPVADEYFKTFTDAGLRVGVTVRPQLPVRTAYGLGVRQIETQDPFNVLDRKISYAKKRWGCTLFYVDSNGDPNVPFPAGIFARLAAKHPGILLIPEHENAQYYSVSAPYRCYGNLKQLGTPGSVRRVYPEAFSCVAVAHADPEPVEDRLVEDIRRGDILIVNSWYRWKGQDTVKRIYRKATR